MMDREYLQDRIRKLIQKPWISEGDLMSLYTILVALPISGGNISFMLADLAQNIDEDLKTHCIKGGLKDADSTTRTNPN